MPFSFTIDQDACEGHGQCVFAAPDVFEIGSDGRASARVQDVDDDQALVREAAEVCPMQAIVVED